MIDLNNKVTQIGIWLKNNEWYIYDIDSINGEIQNILGNDLLLSFIKTSKWIQVESLTNNFNFE